MLDTFSNTEEKSLTFEKTLKEHFLTSTKLPEEAWNDIDTTMKVVYSILPLYTEEISDYSALLKGKTAIAFGFTNNEKRYLKRHVVEYGGNFRFTKNDKEDFFIVYPGTWIYDMLYALKKAREENAIIVNYDFFIKRFADRFSDEEEEKRKIKEREEKAAKPKKGPIYKALSDEDLSCIPNVSIDEISLEDDVFHVVGKIHSHFYYYVKKKYVSLNSKNDVYDYIIEKGGQTIKKDSPRITCGVYGGEPAEDTITRYLDSAKFVDSNTFLDWLQEQETINVKCREFGTTYSPSVDPLLRPYQQESKETVFKKWNSYFDVMLQLPTGAGKTVLFTSIINDLNRVKGTKILILAHRKELIDQISEHLTKYNIIHGIITSGRVRRLEFDVQVASIQTITHRDNQDIIDIISPKFIIIDEAHHSLAKTYTTFWKKCQNTWKLGVTATPYRLNKKPLKGYFNQLVMSYEIEKFIELGYLSDYTLYIDNPNSDISKAIDAIKERSSTGDYKTSDLLEALNIHEHIQKLILCYLQYAKDKKGIVYAISKEHAFNICQAYQKIGVAAEYVDSETSKTARQDIIDKFKKGELSIMVNVNIFSEGFDCPDIEFIQLARPTWSLALYLQQVGRGMRISSNKEQTVILDNAGLFARFGYPSSKREWESYFEGDKCMWDIDWSETRKYNRLKNFYFNKTDLMIKVPSLHKANNTEEIQSVSRDNIIPSGSQLFKQNRENAIAEKENEEKRLADIRRLEEEKKERKKLEEAEQLIKFEEAKRIEEEKRKKRIQREQEEAARQREIIEKKESERKLTELAELALKKQLHKSEQSLGKEDLEKRRQERLLKEEQEKKARKRQERLKNVGLIAFIVVSIIILCYTGLWLIVGIIGLLMTFSKK